MCSISSPTSCSITPRSSVIVRRCGASSEKSCGGNAAKNRLNLPCSNRRAIGGVPYGIDGAPALRRRRARRLSQAKIAFTDSALRSAYRSAGSMNLRAKKVPKTPLPRQSNDILSPARQHNQMRGMAGGLVCDAVSFDVARRRARAPGEGDQAAGANHYAFAGETYDGKLMSQLLIALE